MSTESLPEEWSEIGSLLKQAANDMALGQMLSVDHFDLADSMSAIEVRNLFVISGYGRSYGFWTWS